MNKLISKNTNGLNYTGSVTVWLKHGKHLKKIQSGNNKGTFNLFNFIAQCIAGSYSGAEARRPVRIRAYYDDTDGAEVEYKDRTELSGYLTNLKDRTSTSVYRSETAAVKSVTDVDTGTVQYKVTLNFIIPASIIIASSGGTANTFNTLCLFDDTNDGKVDGLDAYYKFYDTDAKKVINIGLTGEDSLKVEWTLYICNA